LKEFRAPGTANPEAPEADIDADRGDIVQRSQRTNLMRLAAFLSMAIFQVTACTVPASALGGALGGATPAVNIPAPAVDEPAGTPGARETALLAGGCFWGVQGVFEHVSGVDRAVSGYAGGAASTANYDMVSTGTTGHAESVQITYDPTRITYGQLLQIYFSVVHDPTQLDKQGPDTGSQYRSAIFANNDTQKHVAEAYIAQLDKANAFDAPIVTRIERASGFFPAEAHHQDFMNTNPDYPYIAINDMPKLDNLQRQFPDFYREKPVLVS
jgi:peptide-methionine (S)-S-oxide reductase